MPINLTRRADTLFVPLFKEKIVEVYSFFPELAQTAITCGAIARRGCVQGTAMGWTKPPVFRLQPDSSCFTIAHELTHLVQGKTNGIPHGEVACDIWTVDRMPLKYLDQRPNYLLHRIAIDWKNERNEVKRLCRQAIELRRSMRTYIIWLRSRIRQL